ncbi:urease accessory protein UreD [Bradyrhizobium sp. LHD-71]|uniref:urease accessory protein UreD n=1 Tax=Bradyrhizobium sp. LHD-71 TaxID=3072141 RepID=UPI00280DE205|nr:urease accessory protein UreD [Bradyrhizobium sp. LHD-71]MDQ8726984.1 urease accessory protein UreD [Bradyrhizobium sp. LHD-71]
MLLAPELARYRDEPKQLPSGGLGKNAFLRLGFRRSGRRTILAELNRRAPLLVQQALYWDEEMPLLPCVPIISNSGGILQGDRYAIEIDLDDGAEAHITTQAATKIHEMDANFAAQTQRIVLAAGAYLEYLPHPVIPHRHARFVTHTHIVIDPSATALYSEILLPGRKYYGGGEVFAYDLFSSLLHAARPDGAALFAEKFIIEPQASDVANIAVMGPFHVLANVLLLTPPVHAERIFEQVQPVLDMEHGWACGASRLPNNAGLLYRVLGMESQVVRAKVRAFWSLVRHEVKGNRVPDEFLWG